jgi:hypothetical protein
MTISTLILILLLTAKARAAGKAAVQERARNRALDLVPTIHELRAGDRESLRAIAAGSEERGIPCGAGRQVVRCPGGALVGGGQHPFRRKRRRGVKRRAP